MHWNSLSEFISMGGYGSYIWGSYAVAFVLLTAEIIMLRSRKRRLKQGSSVREQLETRDSKLETAL
jgi:heme exporter protein D